MGCLLKICWKWLKSFRKRKLRKYIKVIVMDVDGTLTDGTINIGPSGEAFKRFYCKDGLAIIAAEKYGIIPIILTSRKSEIVKKRSEELGIVHVYQGCTDYKCKQLKKILNKLQVDWSNVAYIGDDLNDLDSMRRCGIVGCPCDSAIIVRRQADYICRNRGGKGAVREFLEWLFEGKKVKTY